jgi:hypothetical protein
MHHTPMSLYGTCPRTRAESGTLVSTHALEHALELETSPSAAEAANSRSCLPADSIARVLGLGADVPNLDGVQKKKKELPDQKSNLRHWPQQPVNTDGITAHYQIPKPTLLFFHIIINNLGFLTVKNVQRSVYVRIT